MPHFIVQGTEDPMATLCRMVREVRYEDLPETVVRHARHTLLDAMAVTIGGSAMEGIPDLVELAHAKGGRPDTPLPFYGGRVPAAEAAMVLGPMPRAMDCGDLHEEAGHVNEYIVPTALAVAGMLGPVSGRDLLVAMVVGQEVLIRTGMAFKLISRAVKAGSCGGHYIFGAVATAGRLLGLSQEQLENAQGIARTMTQPHTMAIYSPATLMVRIHHGLVCQAAINACLLASKGITGPRQQVLLGPKGYLASVPWQTDPEALTRGLGTHWEMEGIITKGYSACYFSHAAIDGIRDLRRRHGFVADDIAAMHLSVSPASWQATCEPPERAWNPRTVPECQFSLAYVVSIAALDDKVFLESYSPEARARADVRTLMQRIVAAVDMELPEWGTRLQVQLRDGRTVGGEYLHVKGHPRNPFSEQDFIDKFHLCVPYAAIPLGAQALERLVDDILHLERVEDFLPALLQPLMPAGQSVR